MDEMTFTLHNPLTEEEWDIIEDVDFDHTNRITFHTKHGKDVVFVKRKRGDWIPQDHNKRNGYATTTVYYYPKCSVCGKNGDYTMRYCPNCGADMRGEDK